ncbi:hypothetical protein [Bacillus sp. MUM 13]|uniref:hypothetical protein n=1 Tax=Bacillus sp. MUM 13 TaxID=1678001 RepID=UPI0008F56A78|nr:hypothetical protein [Bacillus sp. MUM 13]OIK08823.1 hypothetical protein BIV59_18745 [Bacillus sp. MUM 13]
MQRFSILYSLISVFILLVGCQDKVDGMNKQEVEKTARHVASEYLLMEEKREFIPTETEFHEEVAPNIVYVNGYYKDNKNDKMFVMIDFKNEYNVDAYGELK